MKIFKKVPALMPAGNLFSVRIKIVMVGKKESKCKNE